MGAQSVYNGSEGVVVGYEEDEEGQWLLVQFSTTNGPIVVAVSIVNVHFITGLGSVAALGTNGGTLTTPPATLVDHMIEGPVNLGDEAGMEMEEQNQDVGGKVMAVSTKK